MDTYKSEFGRDEVEGGGVGADASKRSGAVPAVAIHLLCHSLCGH